MLGWSVPGKAPAEHGSALRFRPLPLPLGKGRAGEGLALRLQARPASRLTPLPQGPLRGREGLVEPSHARLEHYRQGFCRAWLGTTARPFPQTGALSLCRRQGEGWGGVGCEASCTASFAAYAAPTSAAAWWGKPCRAEPCSAGAFPVKLVPSMARHYEVAISRPCSCSRRCRFRARLLR